MIIYKGSSMNFLKIFIIYLLFSLSQNVFSNEDNDILKFLGNSKEYNSFYKLIKKANYEELFIKESKYKKVLYIPTDDAFKNLPLRLQKYIWNDGDNNAAKKIIKTHLYTGSVKQVFKDPSKKVVIINRFEINGEKVKIYSNDDLFVKDMIDKQEIILKGNIEIIPINCVMYLQPSYTDNRLSEIEKKESIVTSCCMLSDNEIDSFIKANTI
ncbi:MAG: hypothetical protein CMJ06_00120 [Pelagibacterales bacterium]|nr:hypothetical protein [Pelagibacterales bacterium]|tara:strand:+ start:3257 stop:3892 length:636 start_codon:yes stop_codon:yes gene_type:complete